MHPYQIEEDINTRKIIVAVIFSIAAAYILNAILRLFPVLSLWWIDYPSVLGFFYIFIWLFDQYIWKFKFIQNWEWLHIPNLSGVWDAEIRTSFDNFEKNISCTMNVRQTASKILITIETETSFSHSVHAAIIPSSRLGEHELIFNYINEPKGDSISSLNIHYGTTWLLIFNNYCDGVYFTGRGRQTNGRIRLERRHN